MSVIYDIRKYRMYGLTNGYGPLAFVSLALRGRRTKKYDLGKSKITGKKKV